MSEFILRQVGDDLSADFVEALKREEKGETLPIIKPNSKLEENILIYLVERYEFYTGIRRMTSLKTDYDCLDFVQAYTDCEWRLREGAYTDLIDILTRYIEETKEDFPYLTSLFKMLLGQVWHDLGQYSESIVFFELSLEELGSKQDYLRAIALAGLADNFIHGGKYEEATQLLNEAFENASHLYYLRYVLHIDGINKYYQNEIQSALKQFKEALFLASYFGNEHVQGRILYSISELHFSSGNYKEARGYIDSAAQFLKEVGNQRDYSFCFMMENMLLTAQNRYDEAIVAIDKAIGLLQNVGNRQDLASCYQMKGETLIASSQVNEAMKYFEMSLALKEEVGNPTLIGLSLFELIIQSRIHKRTEKIDRYYQRLRDLVEQDPTHYISNYLKIIEAYDLKASIRMKDLSLSMMIFQELVEKQDLDHVHWVFAVINLCELLLEEYRLFEGEATLQVLNQYIKEIGEAAVKNGRVKLQVQMKIFQNRLLIIQNKLEEAFQILNEQLLLYRSKNNEIAVNMIEEEISKFEDHHSVWSKLLATNSTAGQIIREAHLKDYLSEIANRFNFDK